MVPPKSAWDNSAAMRFLNHNFSWVQRVFSGMVTMFLVLAVCSSVLVAQVATCCNANRCPIHGHDHKKNHAAEKSGMDCGHDMPGMTACSMSCCHDSDRSMFSSVAFVLPPVATVPVPMTINSPVELAKPLDFPRSFEPHSPPPRFLAVAA